MILQIVKIGLECGEEDCYLFVLFLFYVCTGGEDYELGRSGRSGGFMS